MKSYKLIIQCPKCKNIWFGDENKLCDVCSNKKVIKKTRKEFVEELSKLLEAYN